MDKFWKNQDFYLECSRIILELTSQISLDTMILLHWLLLLRR